MVGNGWMDLMQCALRNSTVLHHAWDFDTGWTPLPSHKKKVEEMRRRYVNEDDNEGAREQELVAESQEEDENHSSDSKESDLSVVSNSVLDAGVKACRPILNMAHERLAANHCMQAKVGSSRKQQQSKERLPVKTKTDLPEISVGRKALALRTKMEARTNQRRSALWEE